MHFQQQTIISPYRVEIIDDYFESSLVRAACEAWPRLDWDNWHKYSDKYADKYASKWGREAPIACLKLLDQMSEFPIKKICPGFRLAENYFPDYSFHAGGLHSYSPGGKLDIHVDALDHPIKNWQRVVNLLLYITPDWQEEWGGAFGIYNNSKELVHKINIKQNRLILFCPTETAFHGVDPISKECPVDRRSLATFFWRHGEKRNLNQVADFT